MSPGAGAEAGARAVLGIDAAWTSKHPSGVALVVDDGSGWRALAAEPSLQAFVGAALAGRGTGEPPLEPPLEQVLEVARLRAGVRPEVVAIDMPLARCPVRARRAADDEVSRRFGRSKCSTHSPTPARPGPRAEAWRAELEDLGLPLATAETHPGAAPASLEVYPHVSLLHLCRAEERLPYKVSRSGQYWPGTRPAERVERLLEVFRRIHLALEQELGPLPLHLPPSSASLAALKPLEDTLDALVCAWTAAHHLGGSTRALGDADAAIWVPRALLPPA